MCTGLWIFKWPAWLYDFLHAVWAVIALWNPVYVKMCRFKPLSWRDDKLQIVHLLGLSPLWMRRCLFRYSVQLNPFWHSLHLWAFWSLCIFACCFEFAKLLVFCIVHIWLFQCVKACKLLGFQQNWNLCCIVHIWNVFFL